MDSIIAFLMNWGYMGMAISAFLAASILPFSSEAVMVGLLAAGLDMWALVAWGTVGNVLGSLFNYGIGRMDRKVSSHQTRRPCPSTTLHGWPRSMDGPFLMYSRHRRCHHHCSRTHARQSHNIHCKRNDKQACEICLIDGDSRSTVLMLIAQKRQQE